MMNSCSLQTRRHLLQASAAGFGHLAFSSLLAETAIAQQPVANPLTPQIPRLTPTAKRVVFLFMKGGPSHVDTFDPKPLLNP